GAEDYQSAGGAGILEQIGIERGGEAVQPVLDPGGREGAGANEGLRPEPNGKKAGGDEDADQNRVRERQAQADAREQASDALLLRGLQRDVAGFAEIKLAGAEIGQRFHAEELVRARAPKGRQFGLGEFLEAFLELRFFQGVQDHQALPFLFIGHGGNDKGLLGTAGEFLEQILDLPVRHHFTADFAEAAEAVGNAEKSVFIHRGNVAGVVPAIPQHGGGFLGLVKVAAHDVGATHEKQSGLVNAEGLERFGIDDLDGDAGERMADAAALASDLPERGGPEIATIDGDDGRAFGAAITFERANAETILEGDRDAFRKFFRASHDEAQAAEIFRFATAGVSVEKGGSGEEHGCGVRANERADDAGIQRIGMEDDTDASGSRETQRAGKTKGMKEGENPENAVVGM